MAITEQSAEQLLRMLKRKVEAGNLDPETAERLAVLAIQEIKVADQESDGADTTGEDPAEEPMEEEPAPKPAPAIDPSSQLLALINQFDQGTASLWTSIKAKMEEVLKGVEGAAFPLGDFSSNASTAAKGNKTKLTISKGDNNTSVDVNFQFGRQWNIAGLNPPDQAEASAEATCHLGLRKELLALAQDITDLTDSEMGWRRGRFPEKTVAMLTEAASKENDSRVANVMKECPAELNRTGWRKWSLAAQVYVLGNDYSDKKTFGDIAKEIKE